MQCCFHDKKKLPYRVKWGVFTFYVRCVIALKTNDNTSPQPRTVLLEVEQYKHLLNCHYVIQRNRVFLDEYCINMRSLRHTKSRNRKGYVVFLLQILPDFSGVQSEFDRDLIKMRRIFRVPLSCGKNGKNKRVFLRNWHYIKCDLCTMICLPKMGQEMIIKKDLKIGAKYGKINIVYIKEIMSSEFLTSFINYDCAGGNYGSRFISSVCFK